MMMTDPITQTPLTAAETGLVEPAKSIWKRMVERLWDHADDLGETDTKGFDGWM